MRLTITALTASLLVSTAAIAADTSVKSSIDALPAKGSVSISGTVDRVVDNDTFILRDAAGETIDVHSASALTVKEGQQVSVKGEKTAEVAGMGEEIKAASITGGAMGKVAAKTTSTVGGLVDTAATKVSNVADKTERVAANATSVEPTDTPYSNKNNKADLPNTAYDVDVNRDKDGSINVSADRTADVKRDAAGAAIHSDAVRADAKVDAKASAPVLSNIETLPESGPVELSGVVSRVSGNDSFTLKGADGKTINVQTASTATVKEGDSVRVDGQISDRLLGFGKQVEGAKVMVVGSTN